MSTNQRSMLKFMVAPTLTWDELHVISMTDRALVLMTRVVLANNLIGRHLTEAAPDPYEDELGKVCGGMNWGQKNAIVTIALANGYLQDCETATYLVFRRTGDPHQWAGMARDYQTGKPVTLGKRTFQLGVHPL